MNPQDGPSPRDPKPIRKRTCPTACAPLAPLHRFRALRQAIRYCELYHPTECWNYFKAAGYIAG